MIAVIGVGSPFGADQLGWRVVDCLQQTNIPKSKTGQKVDLYKLDRPGSGVIDQLQGAHAAILKDAVISEQLEGNQLVVLSIDELLNLIDNDMNRFRLISSHEFGLAEAIQLAKSLNVLPEKTTLVGLNLTSFSDLSNSDSQYEISQEQVHKVADRVCQLLQTL